MKKRVLSALLALCLTLSLAGAAFAENETVSPAQETSVSESASSKAELEEEKEPEVETETKIATTETAQKPSYPAQEFEATVEDADVTVSVSAPEGALPEDVTLTASLVGSSEDNADDQAVADVAAELGDAGVEYDGFVALDISFVDADGNKVEPLQPVSVNFTLPAELLPEDVDASTLEVQHLKENEAGEVEKVEPVADTADATEGTVTVDGAAVALSEDSDTTLPADAQVAAEFTVDGFSTFTITWNGHTLYVQRIDEQGTSIGSNGYASIRYATTTQALAEKEGKIYNYTFTKAVVAQNEQSAVSGNATEIYWIRYNNDNRSWQYNTGKMFNEDWTNLGRNTVYLIYHQTTDADTWKQISTTDLVDNETEGITVNLFNYNGNVMTDMNSAFPFDGSDWTYANGGVRQNLVQSELNGEGVPVLVTDSKTLDYLFDPDTQVDQKYSHEDVNYLFQQDQDGYFYFDSSLNYAQYDTTNNVFILYNQARAVGGYPPNYPQFLPFNKVDGSTVYKEKFDYQSTYYNFVGHDLSRNESEDYAFGMTIDFEFNMTKGGKINDQDMVFDFAGDDDVWAYIDGVLILDMGGVHDTRTGSINFATGKVTVDKVYNAGEGIGTEAYIGDLLFDAKQGDETWVNNNLEKIGDHYYLKKYTTHELKFFYLERGAGGSNCKIRFNMQPIPANSLNVTKQVETDNEDALVFLGNFEYQYVVVDSEGNSLLNQGDTFTLYDNDGTQKTGTVGENGIFTLQQGQRAAFTANEKTNTYKFLLANSTTKFYVVELLEKDYVEQYGNVQYTISSQGGTEGNADLDEEQPDEWKEFSGYKSPLLSAQDGSPYVIFTNQIDTDNLTSLHIRKVVTPGTNYNTDAVFNMQVTVNGEPMDGARYYILGNENDTFTAEDGVIPLKVGQEAVLLTQVVAGSQFTVTEQNAENYTVTLSGEKQVEDKWQADNFLGETTDASATGTVSELGQTLRVTVTNSDYDIMAELPITKTLQGYTQGSYGFTFQVQQVDSKTHEPTETTAGSVLTDATIDINGDSTGTGTIYVGYKLPQVTDGTYYYKVSEVLDSSQSNVSYDESYYIVPVTVNNENSTATVGTITKYSKEGQTGTTVENIQFTNSLYTTLTIQKTVLGSMGDTSGTFDFVLSLDNGLYQEPIDQVKTDGSTATITYQAANEETGEPAGYYFSLSDGADITLKVPYNSEAKITEQDSGGGYRTYYRIQNDNSENLPQTGTDSEYNTFLTTYFTQTSNAAITMNQNQSVEFINFRPVVAPTGLEDNHTKPFGLMIGFAVLAGMALVGGTVVRRRRRWME